MLLDGKVLGEVPADETGKLALKLRTLKALKKEKVQYVVWIMIGSTILYNTIIKCNANVMIMDYKDV